MLFNKLDFLTLSLVWPSVMLAKFSSAACATALALRTVIASMIFLKVVMLSFLFRSVLLVDACRLPTGH
ncbi:hypothetical protein D3C72_2511260 [compost metagenome]